MIAGYNLARAKGRSYTLAEVTYLYEYLGIEVRLGMGYLGCNPYQISYFLAASGIRYERALKAKTFEEKMADDKERYVIMAEWNGESMSSSAHVFFIDKKVSGGMKTYSSYNFYGSSAPENNNNISDFYIGNNPKNVFMCAYFIEK